MNAGIMLDDTGDLPDVPQFAADAAYVRQACAVAIQTYRGEWFLDVGVGVVDPAWLSAKPSPTAAIERTTRRVLEGVEGVARVASVAVTFDNRGRFQILADVVVGADIVQVSAGAVASAQVTGNAAPGGSPGPGFAGGA